MIGKLIGRTAVIIDDEMTWPAVTGEVADLGYGLRYHPESLTREDQLVLASIVDAYLQMVGDTQKKRNAVCKAIRRASRRVEDEE